MTKSRGNSRNMSQEQAEAQEQELEQRKAAHTQQTQPSELMKNHQESQKYEQEHLAIDHFSANNSGKT